jgi:polar amino acid transport system substrate-binding protein
MAEGGAAPPAEAMRGGKGVSVAVAGVIAIVLFLGGIGVGWLVFSPPPTRVTKLFLGTNTPFPPFEFYEDLPSGDTNLTGFDVDLIEEIVQRGFGFDECTATVTTNCYEWTDFQTFLPLLAAVGEGRIDIGVGAITMNGQTGANRNRTMDFSDPYYEADQGVIKRAGDTTDYCAAANCTAAELDGRAGLRVGVQEITTSQFWALDNLPTVDAAGNLIALGTVADVLLALEQDVVDIVIIDLPAGQGIVAGNPTTFAVEGAIQTDELYGYAVANNDPLGLVPVINAQLRAIRDDGTYDDLIAKWFQG